jgi:hypothetical protein
VSVPREPDVVAEAREKLNRAKGWEAAHIVIEAEKCPHPVATTELFAAAPTFVAALIEEVTRLRSQYARSEERYGDIVVVALSNKRELERYQRVYGDLKPGPVQTPDRAAIPYLERAERAEQERDMALALAEAREHRYEELREKAQRVAEDYVVMRDEAGNESAKVSAEAMVGLEAALSTTLRESPDAPPIPEERKVPGTGVFSDTQGVKRRGRGG